MLDMPITSDLVYQALFFSSIFLTAISLPKIVIYTLWSIHRIRVYRKLDKLKVLKKVVSDKAVRDIQEPDALFGRFVKEMALHVENLKKPTVELISAFILLNISAYELTVASDAVNAINILLASMILVFIFAGLVLVWYFFQMMKMKGGGPLI